ncbi:hypothetical protein [Pseudoalteromonas neustonica]|uniref:hypothetical protein n=1 Tax=Pseudoalteromonas neustonica TaxID=1840331 RepID=UPI0012FE68CC|nr:hypothetical protein [Pseudoalteromonas neustonica]
MKKIIYITLSIFSLSGCVSPSVYKSTIVDHSAFKNLGTSVNYTAKEKRVFVDRKVVSMESDSRYQANITDFGDEIKYKEKSKEILFTKGALQSDSHKDWDYTYKGNIHIAKTIRKSGVDGSKPIMLNKRIEANITQVNNSLIEYSDSNKKITLHNEHSTRLEHPNWDELYYSIDERYGIYRDIKKGVYKLFFTGKSGRLWQYEFIPKYEMHKSLSKGVYRFSVVSQDKALAFDFLPTKNFICADLVKQYASIRKKQGQQLAKTLILGIVQAYTSYSVTTYSGSSTSSYSGVYNDDWGSGSWSGYGTNYYTGYSKTYDYSFVGERTKDLLDIAFNPNASIEHLETAMNANGCKIP